MEPLLFTFAQFIEDAGVAVSGRDLFIGEVPLNLNIGVVLLNNVLPRRIQWDIPTFRQDTFQVVVRHIDDVDGFVYCDRVSKALTVVQETKRNGIKINYIYPKHHPIMFPRLDSNNFEFSINYNYCIAR